MSDYKYVFGPVPSRRMGMSIGISPIPEKYCNYSCIYCQLGRTNHLTNKREEYFNINDIIEEFEKYLNEDIKFDVVTIVGEGEPTLYLKLGELIKELKKKTTKPVAVITNGALLYDENVRDGLKNADIVLPSLDAANEENFKKINRPYGKIKYSEVVEGLRKFSKNYKGELWIETMIIKDINDKEKDFIEFKSILNTMEYDRLYINTPVRPPAEDYVKEPSKEVIEKAVKILGGISINSLLSEGFYSRVKDDYEAIKTIIKRHPMNQYEITSFLESRECDNIENIFNILEKDSDISVIEYKTYKTYRLK
ncbi:radical SAM protein [Caldisalinibacter kiritimatiensis]|uniref:Fe-S oxidoreductase n=1 Tax=Caldisalinibacter kiritimatiensis TaxID=1304284 RepID=R1CE04_9FIRM|nr:radical SAM protein [Caldisalinibacter kiritimatiensis]EOD00495.1 Fe-S oxidoreductase [Caldisalinibacter kiritimatiensis]